jgi:hypothetical protein
MRPVGHVFVVQGDLTKLACDAYLIPTDVGCFVTDYWTTSFGYPPADLPADWSNVGNRVTRAVGQRDGQATVRWVNTGSIPGTRPVEWLETGIRQALLAAGADVELGRVARNKRARPLIGMPMFGTGAGGFGGVRGEVLDMLLQVTHEIAETADFDIVLVCQQRSDYAALQGRPARLSLSESSLTAELAEAADELGAMAHDGRLVLFLGAGVSVAAGLPTWEGLLAELQLASDEYRGRDLEAEGLNLPERASRLRSALGDEFDAHLLRALSRNEYGLEHALLASLRVQEVITTNFDDLYEQAALPAFHPVGLRVLPWQRAMPAAPWLLKLHGGIGRQHVVLSSEDFEHFDDEWRPLASIVQALLMTRHMLFVGYSLTDATFVRLARDVSRLLRDATTAMPGASSERLLGTVLSLLTEPSLAADWAEDLKVIPASNADRNDQNATPAAGRSLEIFLDRVAAKAASDERSYVLDSRYAELLDQHDREVAAQLRGLSDSLPRTNPMWNQIHTMLQSYGAPR